MDFTDYSGKLVICELCCAAVAITGIATHGEWHLSMGQPRMLLTEEGRRRVAGRKRSTQ